MNLMVCIPSYIGFVTVASLLLTEFFLRRTKITATGVTMIVTAANTPNTAPTTAPTGDPLTLIEPVLLTALVLVAVLLNVLVLVLAVLVLVVLVPAVLVLAGLLAPVRMK